MSKGTWMDQSILIATEGFNHRGHSTGGGENVQRF